LERDFDPVESNRDPGSGTGMDIRLEAFKSPEFDRVFGAVASLPGAVDEERLNVPDIEADADKALSGIVAQAKAKNPDPAARLLLIRGQTGTGKTHTLLTAIRRMHRQGHVYAALFPMVDPVSEAEFDSWLLRALITRLSERYLAPQDEPAPLFRLAERLLTFGDKKLAASFRGDVLDNDGDVRDFDLRPLVLSIRAGLERKSPVSPSEPMVAALLGLAAGDGEALAFLRGQSVAASLGGIRLAQHQDQHVARAHIDSLAQIVGMTGGALFLAFDQLEQSRLDGWEARLRHLISRGALLAETQPSLCVTFAVLPALYDSIADGIDGSIRDRIERFGALPVPLKPLGRRQVEALLKRRLGELFTRTGIEADSSAPLHPFPKWLIDELGGQTSRYVFEMVQQFRRHFVTTGELPGLEDMPAPVEAAMTPAASLSASVNFGDKWQSDLSNLPVQPLINTGNQQAEILEWALQAAALEIPEITAIKTRRVTRGRSATVVIEADFQKDGRSLEKREIALCNEGRGAPLAEEIRGFLRSCQSARPVLVRPRGGRLPRTGRLIAPLMRDAEARDAIVVPQFETIAWERLEAAKHFFRNWANMPGFETWQREARPLTETSSFSEILQFPYARPASVEVEKEDEEKKAASAPKAKAALRREPAGPAVLLGEHGEGGHVHWAPFESDARLLNFGLLVTGDPGSGKTQTLNVLIDGVVRMGFPICIFDFKNDYSDPDFVSAQRLKVHDVRRNGIPFNPLLPSAGEDGLAQPIEHIFTITGVLKRVFGLGDRQAATLRDAMKEAFEKRGINPQKWVRVDTLKAPSFNDVVAILEEQKEAKHQHAISLLDRIAPLFELGLFPNSQDIGVPFEALLGERLVLSLFALPTDEIKAALAELMIIRLHGVLVRGAQPRKLTRLLVLDEAWRVASSTHLENLAREGRAFGVGIAIGTQYPGDLPPDLSGALDTKIYLKNQQPDHKRAVVRALCGATSGAEAASLHASLEKLTQFEGLIQNQQYLPYARFKLIPYFARKDRGLGAAA
jgi:hypothetical protein